MMALKELDRATKKVATKSSSNAINKPNFPDRAKRPDLSNGLLVGSLLSLLALTLGLFFFSPFLPGSALGQSFAALGSLLLCAPIWFSFMKRSGLSNNPPLWFVAHVAASSLGLLFIALHVANGDWVSPPGLVLLALCFVILQGFLSRIYMGKRLSYLFARSAPSFNFTDVAAVDRQALAKVIENKKALLTKLDANAEEGLFSPTLKHWFRHPMLSFKYQGLITKESRLVGARARAGWLLRIWRRLHIFAALAFVVGLIAHIVVMLFFAGYAANGGDITWWYITAWGGDA